MEEENKAKEDKKRKYDKQILTPLNIYQKNKNKKNGNLELIVCSKVEPILMEINSKDFSNKIHKSE